MEIVFRRVEESGAHYYGLLVILVAMLIAGLGSAYYMEQYGHIVTGMNNHIVWGTPHVFAVFLIVAASGALNVASIASVFGKPAYKPLSRLSGLLALALLIGGLCILLLDLGRPDRLIIAMTHFNFKSIFAWNVFLYTGFIAIVAAYLWSMMERRMGTYTRTIGTAAFVWRILLTTGTGSIFGFLVAREAYASAMLAPMFIALSFSYGLAIYLLVLMAACRWTQRPLGDAIMLRLKKLLAIFIGAALYFVAIFHLTNLYFTKRHGFERFALLDGGIYTLLFWLGEVVLGSLLPMLILFHPRLGKTNRGVASAAALVVVGGMAQMYVTIIGGQAYPLELFPGAQVSSSYGDGLIHAYVPSMPEVFLGLGGVAIAGLLVLVGVKLLEFLPESLGDDAVAKDWSSARAPVDE